MRRSNTIREVVVTREAHEQLTSDEICEALTHHEPEKLFTVHSSEKVEIVIVTEDGLTQVMVYTGRD